MTTSPLKIVLTGGGTAGHVMPHIALLPHLIKAGYTPRYIGSIHGIERKLITQQHIPYHAICTGKLRRYRDWRNLVMPFTVCIGIIQALWLLARHRPQVIFSKGGFVALPVVIAAWCWRIPVVAHESDLSPGLANRLSLPMLHTLCLGFAATQQHLKNARKAQWTGTPVRAMLYQGQRSKGLALTQFEGTRPILLIIGGSLGAQAINQAIESQLDVLLTQYQIIHIGGQNQSATTKPRQGYRTYTFVGDELGDLMACADCVITRAGANTLAELIALQKPHILIPLPTNASRGDQVQNAGYMQSLGLSMVVDQANLAQQLQPAISQCLTQKAQFQTSMRNHTKTDPHDNILRVIQATRP